ncbi:hypothetical protein NUW58_g362 [Xylaria curta]|uniref:Uncharacterized protein n=1 Tax=Xylaria curta TaxID=42375 RepID=A0ACC1PS92_9PEZI|nr:hypothetical protein NUW58_g362 [Xylaria curta]
MAGNKVGRGLAKADPVYLTNKIAQLWVEVAKRSWAGEWMDMDSLLVQLWQVPADSAVHKEFVLAVLETLSDEIFNSDDMVVHYREKVLTKASIEIFTPTAVLLEAYPNREAGPQVRSGEEGWLARVVGLLQQCLSGDIQNNEDLRGCALRSLAVLYTVMPWVIPKAVAITGAVPVICEGLKASHIEVQKASLEALHALYARSSLDAEEFTELVVPLYDTRYVTLFRQLFEWSVIDPDDLDDDKYQLSKKLSELISYVANYLDRRFSVLPTDPSRVDLMGFLHLLLLITQNQSLVVSIPVLVTWVRLLYNRSLGPNIAATAAVIGPLLEVCSSRLIRYESLPEDSEDPTIRLLFEDTDTIPERHLFLGNYRRYASQIIETIVYLKVSDAMQHILGQTENVLAHLYDDSPPLDMVNYSKVSQPVLRVDARATVIEAALKGYSKWQTDPGEGKLDAQESNNLESSLETWCNRLLEMKFEDPLIRKRILQLLVAFSTSVLDKKPSFMLKVLEHILVTWPATHPEHQVYSDAIKELQGESMVELQRLATKMPDHLLASLKFLTKVNEMVGSGTLDEKRQISYQTFLFTIVHRSRRLDQNTKVQKLRGFLDPIRAQWQDAQLKQSLVSYAGFCELMALDKAQEYVIRKRMHEVQDWGSVDLDEEGKALQVELEARQTSLPLRLTKSFLTCSVDKVGKNQEPFQVSSILWQDCFPIILPELLKFLSYAHASHSPTNWAVLPPEMKTIVGRILTDRFWQSGISEGSKEDFYARVLEKKHTLEGLASTIRGSIRYVRESCYAIIYCMTRLDTHFYGFGELPEPLALAVLGETSSLSAHQLINLLNLVRYLVDNCPVSLRDHFLPPILEACFRQMDARINDEWTKLGQQQVVESAGDDLTEEMKNESILRQLTYTSVMLVADFLDPARMNQLPGGDPEKYPSLRNFCLMRSSIVEPLLVFCTRVIGIKDTRCCSVMLRVLKSIVPEFSTSDPTPAESMEAAKNTGSKRQGNRWVPADTASAIREYMSRDIIMACVTSLHEPHFVEQQKELASLIATIVVHYSRLSSTARDVLVSLPNMIPEDVDKGIEFMVKSGTSSRGQRAVILELLRNLKGVSVSEMGKLSKSVGLYLSQPTSRKPTRSMMAQRFMTAPESTNHGTTGTGTDADNTNGLDGLTVAEVSSVVAIECAAHAHETIDDALRTWLSLASRCRTELALSEDDVAACSQYLLQGNLFVANAEYVRTQIIYSLLQDDERAHLYPIASFLLLDGRANDVTFRKMIEESCFYRLIELINGHKEDDPPLHRLLLELIYEMSRVQKLRIQDLINIDDGFVNYLFELTEILSDDVNDPYHYPIIRVLLVLNEQYMVASATAVADANSPTIPLTNRVVKCLSLYGINYKTFGENLILLLNRETETSMQLLILKLLYLLFTTKATYEYFYTNDLHVLLDVIIRNLLDLPNELTPLRHTYLRVLYPLLAHTPLSQPPHYKKKEIQKLMKLLAGTGNTHFEAADETTLRLVDRVAKVKWLQEDGAGEIARRSLGISLSPTDTASNISVVDVAEVMEKPGVQTRSRKAEGEAELAISPIEAKGSGVKVAAPIPNRAKKPPPEVPKHSTAGIGLATVWYALLRGEGGDLPGYLERRCTAQPQQGVNRAKRLSHPHLASNIHRSSPIARRLSLIPPHRGRRKLHLSIPLGRAPILQPASQPASQPRAHPGAAPRPRMNFGLGITLLPYMINRLLQRAAAQTTA